MILVVANPILVLVLQLEKMKNENWLLSQDDHFADPKFPELQRELMRLDEVLLCILHLPKKPVLTNRTHTFIFPLVSGK